MSEKEWGNLKTGDYIIGLSGQVYKVLILMNGQVLIQYPRFGFKNSGYPAGGRHGYDLLTKKDKLELL